MAVRMPTLRLVVASVALLALACGAEESAGEALIDAGVAADAQPAIGEACTSHCGLRPDVPCVPRTTTQDMLPIGVGFCMEGGSYPHGYFTMNCRTDADCPGGPENAYCSTWANGLCLKPCSGDEDCASPTVCFMAALEDRTESACACPLDVCVGSM